jgi:DNA-binding transcriptional LysR family regulator
MDLKKLEYFLTIAKEGHITKAAQALYVAQPALSYQLKALEQELGVQLVKKNGRNITLTEHGRILYEKGPLILDFIAKTVSELHEAPPVSHGPLSIGNASPWAYATLPNQIYIFKKSAPNANVSILQGDSYRVIDLLNSGVIEIGFVTLPPNPTLYESRLLDIEALVAFFGSNCNYGRAAEYITLRELADCPHIVIHHHLHGLLSTYYKRVGVKAQFIQHDNINSMLDCAANQQWVVIGPKSIYDLNPRTDITYKSIVSPPIEVVSYMIWKKNHNLSKTASEFIEIVLAHFTIVGQAANTEIYTVINDPDRLKKRTIS